MDATTRSNRAAWEAASHKHVREYAEILAEADAGTLFPAEREILGDVLRAGPAVLHPQSGNGTDDVALARAGARSVLGVDYSAVAVTAAQRRAYELGVNCRYVVAGVPRMPVRDRSADLVYTGKGALIWMPDLAAWAADMARVLRPGGHVFLYEGHPTVPLWTWDVDEPRIRPDRSYFGTGFVNDSFPAYGAVECQFTLGGLVTEVVRAGLEIVRLSEFAEPFWRWGDLDAAAWRGRLPNAFALLARRRP